MKSIESMVRTLGLLVALFGCAVVQAQYPGAVGNGASRNAASVYVDGVTFRREMTHFSADMRVLQEDMKLLITRMNALEAEIQGKDAQIRELQDALARSEQHFQKMEQDIVQCEERIRKDVSKSLDQAQQVNQKTVDNLRGAMVKEISRVDKATARALNGNASRNEKKPVYTGAFKEITVEKGDTLGAIANACGVSVQTVRQVNGLNGNMIRVGQKLKIPVDK